MAKLWVTIDRLDGMTTMKSPYHPDEIDTRGMLFKLSERGIAGITFTNADPLRSIKEPNHTWEDILEMDCDQVQVQADG